MEYNRDYFKGKTAVVTGAASGIGLALIEELLQSGAAKVVLADINPDNLKTHEKRLQELHGHDRVKGILSNVTKEGEVKALIAQSLTFFGDRFDLLFNNAGAGFAGVFDALTDEDWKAAFDLNFYSALYGIRAVVHWCRIRPCLARRLFRNRHCPRHRSLCLEGGQHGYGFVQKCGWLHLWGRGVTAILP